MGAGDRSPNGAISSPGTGRLPCALKMAAAAAAAAPPPSPTPASAASMEAAAERSAAAVSTSASTSGSSQTRRTVPITAAFRSARPPLTKGAHSPQSPRNTMFARPGWIDSSCCQSARGPYRARKTDQVETRDGPTFLYPCARWMHRLKMGVAYCCSSASSHARHSAERRRAACWSVAPRARSFWKTPSTIWTLSRTRALPLAA
mmetsp:Transcript_12368/g.39411  ORF Transcript_12368/g.39411 Transcript_12368/m.39411 type:complete len:204 (+) Transcript_12368:1263-1874(+)